MLILIFAFMQVQFLVRSQIIWPGTGEECNILGTVSGVVCVTETDYKLSMGSSEIYSCQLGTVCANQPDVCTNASQPVCSTPRCGRCLPGATGTCVDRKQYVTCDADGYPSTAVKYCQAARPYCMVQYENGLPVRNCGIIISEECDNGPAIPLPPPTDPPVSTDPPRPTDPLPPRELDNCDSYGIFYSRTDPTCQKYYYCSYSNGKLVKNEYICNGNSVFHRVKKKCVPPTDYECEYEKV